jgi:16S rRNA G966 N2-methylase RsmD
VDDAQRILSAPSEGWDLIFLDPPYAEDPLPWASLAAPRTRRLLVVEHRADRELPAAIGPLLLDRRRAYGEGAVSLFRPPA